MTDFENSIVSAIRDCIDRHTYCDWNESEGLYCCEIYADYRDEADNKSVASGTAGNNGIRTGTESCTGQIFRLRAV